MHSIRPSRFCFSLSFLFFKSPRQKATRERRERMTSIAYTVVYELLFAFILFCSFAGRSLCVSLKEVLVYIPFLCAAVLWCAQAAGRCGSYRQVSRTHSHCTLHTSHTHTHTHSTQRARRASTGRERAAPVPRPPSSYISMWRCSSSCYIASSLYIHNTYNRESLELFS